MKQVLIIDDDKELCALMKKCIEQENLSAVTAIQRHRRIANHKRKPE